MASLLVRTDTWDSVTSPSTLLKRQQGGTNGTTAPPNGNAGNNNSPGQAPLTVYTFIIAIALFVLVVSFVLLRIFVRNRRLRQLGLYPESPIERLLGGAPREYEDNLPPPKLWDAKIADVRANNSGALARAEKSMLGGGVGAGDVRENGWDALMPVSAALPPNMYPIIFQQDSSNTFSSAFSGGAQANGGAHAHQQAGGRLGRHMTNFLRRSNGAGEQSEGEQNGLSGTAVNADASGTAAGPTTTTTTGQNELGNGAGATDEKLISSVNVTVLIAMPSPQTVFPTARRPVHGSNANLRRSTSKLNSSGILASAQSKLEEVNEGADTDSLASHKGKARRAPSLRSIRTTASAKSQGEARREAFFGAQAEMEDDSGRASAAMTASNKIILPPVDARPYDDEEDELPELVFGTASVPLYSRIVTNDGGSSFRAASAPAVGGITLIQPTRDEIVSLISTAAEARMQRGPTARSKNQAKSDDDGEAPMSGGAARQSMAGTSMEGVNSAEDQRQGYGDVVSRMLRDDPHGAPRSSTEAYELGDLSRPSIISGGDASRPTTSLVGHDTHNTYGRSSSTHDHLLSSGAPMGLNDGRDTPLTILDATTPMATPPVATQFPPSTMSSVQSAAQYANTARTAYGGASSPTNTHTDRQSISTWHTGDEDRSADDDVAIMAAHAIHFEGNTAVPNTATARP